MNEIIREIEKEQLKEKVDSFRVGDTVRVHGKIKEGNRERIQIFEGTVLKIQGGSNTGGYIIGFIFSALFMWAMEHLLGRRTWVLLVSMLAGLVICYAFGTAWFMLLYMRTTGPVGLVTVLGWCVFPFVLPDLLKILLAMTITARLRPYVR